MKKRKLSDELAIDRTSLAYERTTLAYIRTGISIILAGLFFIGYFQSGVYHDIGWIAALFGMIFFVFGIKENTRYQKIIKELLGRN